MKSIADGADPLNTGNWHQHPGPVFWRNDAAGVFGPGHNGFFKSPDGTEDWIVYHGKTTSAYTYAGRTTRAQKLTWNADGTPNFGRPHGLGALLAPPAGDPEFEWRTQFADIDGDGKDEVIAVGGNGDVLAWRNTGGFAGTNQTYTAGATLIAGGFVNPSGTRFADIDGDGKAEIITISPSGDVLAWRNVGGLAGANQTYTTGSTLIARSFTSAAATRFADIDGDGKAEIIVTGQSTYAWRNVGGLAGANQTFTAGATLIAGGFTSVPRVRFADVDGDGKAEIVALNPDGDVLAWRNVGGLAGGNQTYTAGSTLIARGFTVAGRVRFADIDTGGRADIALTGNTNLAWRNAGGLAGSNQTYTVGSTIIAYGFQ